MEYEKNIYFGESVITKKNKILHKLKRNKFQPGIFLITLPADENGLLEIYPSYIFLQDLYIENPLKIIGIAGSKMEALEMIQKIIMECFNNNKDFNIEKFMFSGGVS